MRKMVDIDFGSSRYDELVNLRYKILLEPLGLKFLDYYRPKEASYLHIACIEQLDDKLLGGLILAPVDNEEIRLMQVVGHEMVQYALKRAKEVGYTRVVMHAMLSVVGFYEELGFVQEGELFDEGGITFARMVKSI